MTRRGRGTSGRQIHSGGLSVTTGTTDLISTSDKIYVAGHRGLAGSAIWDRLTKDGYGNLVGRSSSELDLRDREATEQFFAAEQPEVAVLAAARRGAILANSTCPGEFLSDSPRTHPNGIDMARRHGARRLLFL